MLKKNQTSVDEIIIKKEENLFPFKIFNEDIIEEINYLKDQHNLTPEIIAASILFSASNLLGNNLTYTFSNTWIDNPSLWIIIIDESGALKTQAFKYALKFIQYIEKCNNENYTREFNDYLHDKARYDLLTRAQKAETESPEIPEEIVNLTNDATTEGLIRAIQKNPKGIGLFMEEFNGFFKSMNQYKGGQGSDTEFYLNANDNKHFRKNRANELNNIYIPKLTIQMLGAVQNKVLREVIKNGENNGMYQRFLYMPISDNSIKSWNFSNENKFDDFDTPINQMYKRVEEYGKYPKIISLQDEPAQKYAENYLNSLEQIIEKDEFFKPVVRKIGTYFGRFSAIIAALNNEEYISINSLHKAKLLSEYFLKNINYVKKLMVSEDIIQAITKKTFTQKDKIFALKMQTPKLKNVDIAKIVGCSKQYVGQILNKNNMSIL